MSMCIYLVNYGIIITEKEVEKKEEGGRREIQVEKKITPAEYRRLHP